MAVDRPSIHFVSCTITSIECNNSKIIIKIDFQIINTVHHTHDDGCAVHCVKALSGVSEGRP